jgi:hypothetical protein
LAIFFLFSFAQKKKTSDFFFFFSELRESGVINIIINIVICAVPATTAALSSSFSVSSCSRNRSTFYRST